MQGKPQQKKATMNILWKWQRSVYFNLWLIPLDKNKKIGFTFFFRPLEGVELQLCYQHQGSKFA